MQVNASTVCTAQTANSGQWTQSAWISDLVGENPEIPPKCRDRSGCANCQTRGNVRTTQAPKVENGDDGLDYNQESLENQEQGNSLLFVEIKLQKSDFLTVSQSDLHWVHPAGCLVVRHHARNTS